ncbi:hypothetical protein INR49_000909 [Caranx melampygus]|nr:hypothetical protein INR49_000909 [Caranx melampygus]
MGRWISHLSVGLGLLLVLLTYCHAEVNYCFAARAKSCSECLQAGKGCAYCPDETFNGPRCDMHENIQAHGCRAATIITAESSMSTGRAQQINTKLQQSQVFPQMMDMTFLPGEEKQVDVEVFAPLKGPLDLYILMDFSNSMADDLDNLKRMDSNSPGPTADGANVLSGILPRNDEQCHLDRDGKYTKDINQDYPSIPTLVRLLGKHNIIPIFAVTNHSYTYYEKLQEYFPIAEVGLLQEDSSNILQVMETAFKSIRSKMSIRAEGRTKAFEAQFLTSSGKLAEYGAFDFKPGAIGKFKMNLRAQRMVDETPVCQLSQHEKESDMKVKPTTFNAALNIQASVLCPTCSCEQNPTRKAALCHGNGDLVCGKCRCYDGWLSTFCNCSASASALDPKQCIGPNMTEPCSGNGDCLECGTCVCYNPDKFEGPYCQYDKTRCPRYGGFLCNGACVCGQCQCQESEIDMTSTCEPNFQAQLGVCEATRTCVQCKAWNAEKNKDKEECKINCPFKIVMVDELKEQKNVLDSCSFRDEDDDCTYHYTAENTKDKADGILELQSCLALLPCCKKGRMVGFREDEYLLRQSLLTSDHLDTPMVRTGPPKGTDVVRWKVTDNVHRGPNHPQALMKPNPKETIQFPVSLRLNRLFSENLSRPESRDAEQLRKEVADNLSEVYNHITGGQKVQKTTFRMQRNAGKRQDYTIMDTVLSAPRSSYPDIIKLTEKNVQSGNFHDLKVVPGYYTVATDREASGAIEFQEGVESVDVHVPLFVKDEDDDKKQLQVEAIDVPLGIAEIGKRLVNITIIKEHASSVFSFLQPAYTYSRQDGVANIPISREIIEDGRTQVSYRTRDLTAKDKKDYVTVEGDLTYGLGETQKTVPVRLLELGEKDSLLEDKQVKQFVMDLSNPRQGAKLGRYPRTTITIADHQEPSVLMFKKGTQNFTTSDPTYTIPVVRTRNPDSPATVKWRTKKAQRFELSGPLKFGPGETEKNIIIDPKAHPGPIQPETFQLELFDPSSNASVGERKTTLVNVTDGAPKSPESAKLQQKGFISQKATSPGGLLFAPGNPKAKPTGPRNIHLKWDPPPGNPMGYKVKYWIYGDPEKDAKVLDVKTPQAELSNLYPYCDYEMRVCAYNAMGDGHNTDIVTCQTLEDVPGEPGRLAFNVISPTVTQLSWAEPAETNGNITAYEVIYTPIDDELKPVGAAKKVKIDNPKKRMLLIENLQNAQTYQYKVRAKNSVGWGPFRDASINLASQPARPLSIPIIPDIPIVDAEAGDEYDSYLMYSNEVLKSPAGSKTPSISGDGWKYVKLVGSHLDLRKVSWKKQVDVIPSRNSTDTETSSDEAPNPLPDYTMNGKWDQSFLFPGGSGNRNLSTSSSPMSTLSSNYKGGGASYTTETTTTYMTGPGGALRQDMMGGTVHTSEVIMRKRSENRAYTDEHIRDSIVMGDMSKFPALGEFQQSALSWVGYTEMHSNSQNQFSYSLSRGPRAGSQSSEVNEALYNLDRVLNDARVSPGVPDTPSRLVFSALGPTALKVSWQEPHCEKDIMGYCVLYQLLNGGDVKRINVTNPAENSVIIQDLLPNHSYLFKVKAQSQEGWVQRERESSPSSLLSTPRAPSAPCQCSGPLVFTALSPDSLQLSWEKPRKPNGDILGYVVTCEQLHGGGDVRSFQVNGDSSETSLTVPNLTENVPYKFKVQAQTTQGFGPERRASSPLSLRMEFNSQSLTKREVFQLPTEVSTRTNVSHTMLDDPYFSGMMMTTQHTETSGMVTRQITKEVVQRGVVAGTTVTKKMLYES